ncbi:MAG: serine hydrolase domain-containing protein [Vicinamibacteraceae bacterium]
MTRPRRWQPWTAAILAASLAAGSAGATTLGQTDGQADAGSIAARIDRLFADWNRPDGPGCSVAVSRAGATVFEKGYGVAHLEHGVPISPTSVFHVASVTKPFTAMSILLLARDGRLSIDDDVRRHLPEWAGPPGVTIRHLLNHTGGLREAFLLIEMASPRDGRLHQRLVDLLTRQRGLSEPPGTRFFYNNGGYVLLAEIVQRTSGQSLRKFVDERIFRPLGMRQSHLHDDLGEIVPALATGYTRGDDGALRVARLPDGIVGNAGLYTTAPDLLRWLGNFPAPAVGDAALITAMRTVPALPGGETTVYGLGLWIERPGGRLTVSHGGSDPGASAYVVRYPEHDLGIAVLCNIDGIDVTGLARGIADVYLGPSPSPSPSTAATAATAAASAAPAGTPPAPVTVTPAALAANEGLYRSPGDESLLRIFVRDGVLHGSPGAGADGGWPVTPLGGGRFAIETTPIVLEFAAAAGGRTLRIVGERPTPAVLERVASYTPAAADLAALVGDYRSDELSTTYTLRVTDGALIAEVPGRSPIALQPIRRDMFAGSLVGSITFERDRAGRPTGFTVHAYAARGIRFERVRPPRRADVHTGVRFTSVPEASCRSIATPRPS